MAQGPIPAAVAVQSGVVGFLNKDSDGNLLVSGTAGVGSPSDAAWNGTDPSASLISIMKACYAQLVTIAENTAS